MTEPTKAPQDPMTAMGELAAQAHEMYLAYVAAGFSDEQALYLVAQVLTAHIRRDAS